MISFLYDIFHVYKAGFADVALGYIYALVLCSSNQIESRPLRKQALRASDDSNNGLPK